MTQQIKSTFGFISLFVHTAVAIVCLPFEVFKPYGTTEIQPSLPVVQSHTDGHLPLALVAAPLAPSPTRFG